MKTYETSTQTEHHKNEKSTTKYILSSVAQALAQQSYQKKCRNIPDQDNTSKCRSISDQDNTILRFVLE